MSAALDFLLLGSFSVVAVVLGSVLLLFPDPDFTPAPDDDEANQ